MQRAACEGCSEMFVSLINEDLLGLPIGIQRCLEVSRLSPSFLDEVNKCVY